jgi:hypothetical protein
MYCRFVENSFNFMQCGVVPSILRAAEACGYMSAQIIDVSVPPVDQALFLF